MKIRILTFSDRGESVAEKLCKKMMGSDDIDFMRCGETISLSQWTGETFSSADALIYIGACGIAVRAIAPFLESKVTDPAVVVVDELGNWAIPILSGHLGGANELANRVAALIGAKPVITTATDINGVFAIDDWARTQECTILEPERIQEISARLLDGGSITIRSNFPVVGKEPKGVTLTSEEGADVHISTRRSGIMGGRGEHDPMIIVPQIAVLGVGCRKGTDVSDVEKCFKHVMDELDIFEEAFYRVCSIDLKKNETGLKEFCRAHELPFMTFSSGELKKVPGEFSSSGFVEEITGVDNVCERSAVLGANEGKLVLKKMAFGGVTMAVAFRHLSLCF